MSAPLRKILYVDDQPDLRELGRLALEVVGHFEVEAYGSGEDALARVEAFSPDLVLLDVVMPGLSGPETMVRLRAMPRVGDLPVVFLTARVGPEERAQYHAMGVLGVIEKPFDPFDLAERLKRLWSAADVG
jgi:two-component system, OmpR family, response regulator